MNDRRVQWGVSRASDGRVEVFSEAMAREWADRGNSLVRRVVTTSEWLVVTNEVADGDGQTMHQIDCCQWLSAVRAVVDEWEGDFTPNAMKGWCRGRVLDVLPDAGAECGCPSIDRLHDRIAATEAARDLWAADATAVRAQRDRARVALEEERTRFKAEQGPRTGVADPDWVASQLSDVPPRADGPPPRCEAQSLASDGAIERLMSASWLAAYKETQARNDAESATAGCLSEGGRCEECGRFVAPPVTGGEA